MAKARKSDRAQTPKRLRLHVTISATVRTRLAAYAGAYNFDQGRVVEEALVKEMDGFYFGQRGIGVGVEVTPEPKPVPAASPLFRIAEGQG